MRCPLGFLPNLPNEARLRLQKRRAARRQVQNLVNLAWAFAKLLLAKATRFRPPEPEPRVVEAWDSSEVPRVLPPFFQLTS